MNKSEVKRRIKQLREEINHHRYLYHVLDKQEISEAALDSLKDELVKLEEQHPEYITPDSPTQRVAGQPLDKFVKVNHSSRMLSLNDAFHKEDLENWDGRLERLLPGQQRSYFADPKIDGLAIALIYQDGMLQVGATRGDGFVGEDVTHTIRTIESIPLRLRDNEGLDLKGTIEVRGEVYMEYADFERINKEREKNGEELYMNPRNTAAGSLRQLDPALAAERKLKFFAYSMMTDLGQTSRSSEREVLQQLGFQTTIDSKVCTTLDEVMEYYERLFEKREQLAYQIDGVVVHIDNKELFGKYGVVGKAPRGAVAMKFPAEQATTVVEDIVIQVGRTGALTPVAHLRPVQVAGTTVQRATLHNMDEIERLGVLIGDTVIIQKAGDIIPDIVEVLPNLRSGKENTFSMPVACPECGKPVVQKEGEVAHYCVNMACPARHREGLYHFVSKKALNIDGVGPRIIDQLLDADIINNAADLFILQEDDLLQLEGFQELSASNVVQSITASSTVQLHRFIYALGIRHVGEQTAVMLANAFGSVEAFRNASADDLEHLHDIGPAAADSITTYFNNEKHVEVFDALLKQLTIENPTVAVEGGVLQGKTFLFTGTLQSMTRDSAKEMVRAQGGKVVSSVTKKLDYLVVGKKAGSKLAKAEKLDVTVWTEEQFLQEAQ